MMDPMSLDRDLTAVKAAMAGKDQDLEAEVMDSKEFSVPDILYQDLEGTKTSKPATIRY